MPTTQVKLYHGKLSDIRKQERKTIKKKIILKIPMHQMIRKSNNVLFLET